MKKIVLGCATVLLSLGLLAGCNNDTDSAVTITVDNTATVVVGESLDLPYTVEPEKAKVEVLNDHEEYVTASAKDGLLHLEGVTAGDATLTLVGTYKKYEEANVNISVSVVTKSTVDTEPGTQEGGDGDTGGEYPGPVEETEPHSHDVLVTVPDNKGVYVLGYSGDEGDTYLTYDESELGSSMTYSEAVSVRTIAVDGGYSLQLSEEEYLGAEEGVLAVTESATTVAVDGTTGAITCSDLTLTVDEDGAFVWAEAATTLVVLMDVAYDHDAAAIEDSTNLVLGIIVDGTYEYITGNTMGYTNRGELSSDISEAAVITLTANATAENAYEMTFTDSDGNTRWITVRAVTTEDGASSSTTGFQYETEQALIYWDENNEYWTNEEDTYYLSLWSSYSCLGASTVGSTGASYAPAVLYYDSTVPALRGVVIEDTEDAVPYAGTLQLEYQLYPTCLEDASSLVWTGDDTYVSVDNGLVKGLAITDGAVVAVSGEGIFGDSITLKVESIPVTVEITAQYIIDNFERNNSDGYGDKYDMGSGSGNEANDAEKNGTDVITGTMDFGVFDVEWVKGTTDAKLWTGDQIRLYPSNGGFKVTPHSDWKLTGLSATDSNGKLAAYALSTINGSNESTALTLNTDYTITNENKQLDMAETFSTTDTLFVCNAATGSNTSYFTSITVTCEAEA